MLVLLRRGRKGPQGLCEVRLPKGHVESGESRQETALREVSEEAGLPGVEIVADLGQQTVEFDWEGTHYIRDERYFLMALRPDVDPVPPERQFERLWLSWAEALGRLTYGAEQEWMHRAWAAWKSTTLDDIAKQDTDQAGNHT